MKPPFGGLGSWWFHRIRAAQSVARSPDSALQDDVSFGPDFGLSSLLFQCVHVLVMGGGMCGDHDTQHTPVMCHHREYRDCHCLCIGSFISGFVRVSAVRNTFQARAPVIGEIFPKGGP